MKQYAVIHVQKSTGGGVALGRHIDRTHTPENADKSLSDKNKYCYVRDDTFYARRLAGAERLPLRQRVDERIADGYTGKAKIRKDAVRQLNIILTGSHDRMVEIGRNVKLQKEWIMNNYAFLAKEYGLDNVVGFVVHMDEATPHIHATVVPLTPDGRLSAKEVVGDQKKLKGLQDRYADAMKRYGLYRGEVNSNTHHIDTQEYYRSVNSAAAKADEVIADAPVVELPPAIIGREAYKQHLQTQISDFCGKIARKLKENEFTVLRTSKENDRLKNSLKTAKSPILASQLNNQQVIRRRKKGKGIGL
jgi:hypothetical protein